MIELTIILINLVQKLSCQMILLNVTSLSQQNTYQFDNFIPQGFQLKKEEVILFSLQTFNKSENQPIMELCTDKFKNNCVMDHNAIDFKLDVQNVRSIKQANISNSYKTQYNAIPFSNNVYLEVRSYNSFNLIAQITQFDKCPYDCKNGGNCRQGICICPDNYLSHDCSVMAQSIMESQTLLNSEIYYFDIYQWMEKEDKITRFYFARFEEEAKIIMECYAKNPYLLQNDTEKQLQMINITVDEMDNCLNYVDELESNQKQQFAKIIIKLKQPLSVKFTNFDSSVDPFVIGIIVGSISLFIMIVIIYCIYRCRRDEQIKKKKIEELEKQEKEKKIYEQKENQMMPEFSYAEMLEKFPGLKSDQECEICLNVFKTQDRVRVTYCTHIFHNDCLKQWLNKNKTCPMCRESLNFNQLALNPELFHSDHQNQHISESQPQQYLFLTPKSQNNTRLYGDEHQNIVEFNPQQVNIFNFEENQCKQNQITQ